MTEQGAEPPAGLQDKITEVLNGLYEAGGYASVTWQLDDGSLLSLSRSRGGDGDVTAVTA